MGIGFCHGSPLSVTLETGAVFSPQIPPFPIDINPTFTAGDILPVTACHSGGSHTSYKSYVINDIGS